MQAKGKAEEQRKPIETTVNAELWKQVEILSGKEGRKTEEIIDDAIRLYLKSKGGIGEIEGDLGGHA
ncbi:MAG: hypothetical protein IMF10_01535 [Proteobacteria bacterium]|nr:hypothetical protein [Pseudomonadota bacterium]